MNITQRKLKKTGLKRLGQVITWLIQDWWFKIHCRARTKIEIMAATKEFFDKNWYVQFQTQVSDIEKNKDEASEFKEIYRSIEKKYGRENLLTDDWNYGILQGKYSALQWVRGADWIDEESFVLDKSRKEKTKLCRVRKEAEILAAHEEFLNKVWYDRHINSMYNEKLKEGKNEEQIWKEIDLETENDGKVYGEKNLGPWTDFELGMINGKYSALNWVLYGTWDTTT